MNEPETDPPNKRIKLILKNQNIPEKEKTIPPHQLIRKKRAQNH